MKSLTVLVAIFSIVFVAKAAEPDSNYWEVIKQKMAACESAVTPEQTMALASKYQEFIDSLNANQLLIAARDCAIEVQSKIAPDHWNEALWVGFFCQTYPAKTNNLEDITPLIADLRNTALPPFWKYSIMQFLGVEWQGEFILKPAQTFEAANTMKEFISDASEPKVLRIKAASMSTTLFKDAHSLNLKNDPTFRMLVEQGRELGDLIKDANEGRIMPAKETIELNKSIQTAITESIEAQIDLLSEPNLPPNPGVKLLGSMSDLRDYDAHGQIKQAMDDALHNYKQYDEYLWRYLVTTNIIYFENDAAESILQKMLNDAKNEHERERTLPELKNSIDKGEIKKETYSHGRALVR